MFCIAILYIHIKQMIKPFIRRKKNVYIPLHYELLKRKKIIIGFEEFFLFFFYHYSVIWFGRIRAITEFNGLEFTRGRIDRGER